MNENWSILLEKFRKTLYSWNLRSLDTFQQRIDVLQIFGTSKLWYVCQVLPLPVMFGKKFEAALNEHQASHILTASYGARVREKSIIKTMLEKKLSNDESLELNVVISGKNLSCTFFE